MNREIKFRYWDSCEKQMIHWHKVRLLRWLQFEKIAEIYGHPPMQYTGLKDKNGVEIYEGDIVANVGIAPHAVEWDSEGGLFRCRNTVPNDYNYTGRALFLIKEFPRIEVIGNIYEHPYLLNAPSIEPASFAEARGKDTGESEQGAQPLNLKN